MQLELSKASEKDLDDISRYTEAKWGISQAERYIASIQKILNDLAAERVKGRPGELKRSTIRKVLVGRHFVFYESVSGAIFVSRILHGAMQMHRQTFPIWKGSKAKPQ